ncbi:MAG: DUF4932 domain-containing protein [Candidatus Cloacimonetes bacterium]|nr:DUF4932 domain-containing protein [Candidatus Cloacimonadota bacterium]
MKYFIHYLLLTSLLISCHQNSLQKEIPTIKSNIETIKCVINGEEHPNWKISPELNPDRLKIECKNKDIKVKFITDLDSIEFIINEKDTVQFYILLNEKDSALTEIVGIPKNVHFSDQYIKAHQGKFEVEVPEVHELANIMVAISKVGQLDSNMVDMTTKYHKDVLRHFSPYKNHSIIDTINNYITKVYDNESYWYYYALKMNACGYLFDSNNNIIDDGIIHKMGFDYPDDPIKANKELIEDFAQKSGFRDFYKKYQPFYDELMKTYRELNPIDKMKKWLEDKFKIKYGNYRVTFSPLVGGAHSTQRFEDNGFEQTVMFVCRVEPLEKYNNNLNEMLGSRVVFTEIDHNFANPISDKFSSEINTAFANRNIWVNEGNVTSAYNSPYSVFNEYMTWAIFSLYCIDNFPKYDYEQFIPKMEKQMERNRGFKRFSAFNQKLIEIYRTNPEIIIDELYKQIIEWSKYEK